MPNQPQEYYELYIGFIGLAAFVPRTEELKRGGNVITCATAILPRVIKGDPDVGYTTASGIEMPSHHPKLKLIVGKVQDGLEPNPYRLENEKLQKAFDRAGIEPREWAIDRREISLDLPDQAPEVTTMLRTLRGHHDRFPFDRLEQSDTTWLSSMREIFEMARGLQTPVDPIEAATIDPSLLNDKPPRLASRIDLPRGGCFASLSLVEHKNKIFRYGYESGHPGSTCTVNIDRAISQHVVMRLTVHDPKGEGVRLRSRSLDGGKEWNATLVSETPFDRPKIILVVDHQPDPEDREVHDPDARVEHFEVFYELLENRPDMKNRPVPKRCSNSGKRSLGMVLPGSGALEELSRKWTLLQFGESLKKIKLARALVKAMKKDTGQICPHSTFEPESVDLSAPVSEDPLS